MKPAVPVLPDAVLEQITTHVDSLTDREVGGILVGSFSDEGTRVDAAIPALKAESERANVTFTHDVWSDALGTIDREFPTLRIVGWYHSHPGFGIFLSAYDRFIQQNFFSDEGMVALVVDPHSRARGWFGWDDGEVVRLDESAVVRAVTAPIAARPTHRTRQYIAALVIGAIAGFGGWLGYGHFATQVQETKPLLTSPTAQPISSTVSEGSKIYVVRRGDGLEPIAKRLFPKKWQVAFQWIVDNNRGFTETTGLETGEKIKVPSAKDLERP